MRKNKLRVRQNVFLSTRMKFILGTSFSALIVVLLVIYFNFFEIKNSRAFSSGDYRTAGSGDWEDASVWEVFDGEGWNQAVVPPHEGVRAVHITNRQRMVIADEVALNNLIIDEDSYLLIESNTIQLSKFNGKGSLICNGTLALGTSILEGNGDIIIGPKANLMIGSDAGIDKKSLAGNIQLSGKKEYNKEATYVYNGTVRQHTGNGLPAVLKNLVIDNSSGVELDQNLQVLNRLVLKKGVMNSGRYTFTLGASVTENCIIDQESGALSGWIKVWFGPANMNALNFRLSDGNSTSFIGFSSDKKDFQKGMLELKYHEGIPDDSKKSPFEARQVVVAISEAGHFSAMLSNGPGEAWLELKSIHEGTNGTPQVAWSITSKADLTGSGASSGSGKNTTGNKVNSISNVLFGPLPFKNQLIVRFFSESKNTATMQLSGPKGQVVQMENIQIEQGYNQFRFNPENAMPAGSYMVQISNTSEIHTFKVLCISDDTHLKGS